MLNNTPNPLPCGCRARYNLDTMTGKSIYVAQCPMHEAAAELLKALEGMADLALRYGWAVATDERRRIAYINARAAIAKARPAKVERAGEET